MLYIQRKPLIPISVKGFNLNAPPTYPCNILADIDLKGMYNEYIQRVFDFVAKFPPAMAASTGNQSYIIFNTSSTILWGILIRDLFLEILESGLSDVQKALALIAHSILSNSYTYWSNVYNNTGGSNAWYLYINGIIGNVNDIDWRQLIQQDIKGGLLGAVNALNNNLDNIDGSLIIGAAASGMASSAEDLLLQLTIINGYDPA